MHVRGCKDVPLPAIGPHCAMASSSPSVWWRRVQLRTRALATSGRLRARAQSSILASGCGQHTRDLLSLRELHVITPGIVAARGENGAHETSCMSPIVQHVRQGKATARRCCRRLRQNVRMRPPLIPDATESRPHCAHATCT